jgi:hypothetical protein
MTDNSKTSAPARIYGFARTRNGPDFLAGLRVLGEAQEPQPEPSTEPEASHEVMDLVLASNTMVAAEVNDATSIVVPSESEVSRGAPSAIIEVTTPKAKSRRKKSPSSRRKTSRSRRKKSPSSRRKSLRARGKKKKPTPSSPPQPTSRRERHKELCGICRTKYREEIDDAFINWESVNNIAWEFQIERRVVYRHAHATGLFAKRDRNIRRALGLIIHRADKVQGVTADSVIRAVHMLAHINEAGEWIAPPAHVIVSSGTRLSDRDSRPACPDEGREQSRRGAARLASSKTPPAANMLDTRCQAARELNP